MPFHMKKYILVLFSALMLSGCGAVRMEKPTVKNYNRVRAMSELTPITVEQLRQMIATDTTHYKVVVLTSATCGPCLTAMRDTYPQKMAECDTSLVRWYFVEEDYSSAQYLDETFRNLDISHPRYWIDDSLPQYRPLMVKSMWQMVLNTFRYWGQDYSAAGIEVADDRLTNIINALAPTEPHPITDLGTPTTLMFNPAGKLKCTHLQDYYGYTGLYPTDIRDITVPVTQLDYNAVDTLSGPTPAGTEPKVCTPEGCQ